jgi:hypothetical protein
MITREATAAGMSPSDFIRMAEIESSFDPNAGSKKSSAKGLFQFTNGTAKGYGLKNVYDPLESTRAAIRYAKDNIKATGAKDGADIYMAHQWGSGGFNKMKNADPNASVESVLGVDAARNNAMGGMTVAQGKAFWRNKFYGGKGEGGGAAPTSGAVPQMPARSTPVIASPEGIMVASTPKEVDLFGRIQETGAPPAVQMQYAQAADAIAKAQATVDNKGDLFGGFFSAPSPIDAELSTLIDSV